MPKARRRKDSAFDEAPIKSVFLYGNPNIGKLERLKAMGRLFSELVRDDIKLLDNDPSVILQLVKNSKQDSQLRALERSTRRKGVNSAFSQCAFDSAVTMLSNRLDSIRLDLLSEGTGIFARSKVLFAMSVSGSTKQAMLDALAGIKGDFYRGCEAELNAMTEDGFRFLQREFADRYAAASLEYRIPQPKSVSVLLDSRLMKIEASNSTAMPYVITVTDAERPRQMITVPIGTSRHSLHKIKSNDMAGSVFMSVRGGKLRIGWPYSVKREEPNTETVIGVDTGISDTLYTSDGRAYGSLKGALEFYQDTVEPAFGELSSLRNKKRAISHYLRRHNLPEGVRRSLIRKMDRLERMVQTMDAPYRKDRNCKGMLGHGIASAVREYVSDTSAGTLTVLEKLDIKEFNKSRKANGMLSTFARGQLQKKLIGALNWKGLDFVEVLPEYTSQLCPVCSNVDKASRNGKLFKCTSCGHVDDADHNAAINIRDRHSDPEIAKIIAANPYSHEARKKALIDCYKARHDKYLETIKAESA